MNLTKVLCLIKHRYGRWRRLSSRQLNLQIGKIPVALLAGAHEDLLVLRRRVCARCDAQSWQIKPRRKSPVRKIRLPEPGQAMPHETRSTGIAAMSKMVAETPPHLIARTAVPA